MKRPGRICCGFAALLIGLTVATPARGQSAGSIVNSKHNLSASGPGTIRATGESEICVFCHTPHNSSPIQPVWNRNVPVSAYTVYNSRSLDALPGQPTGSSKLCLSCHDGSIAVGNVLSRDHDIPMAGGATTIPPGKSNLGTDLSDDHPVSFRYDSTLAGRDPKLRNPGNLPPAVKLDASGEMQCSTCHDAHDNTFGKFLVMNNANSQLCTSCHNQGMTSVAEHQQCASCHTQHAAPSGPLLLTGQTVQATCISCHNGQPGATQGPNVASQLNKVSMHDTDPPVNLPANSFTEVTCNNCHEPHTMMAGGLPGAPLISPKLGRIDGINVAGATVVTAQYQYEVCFKCHGDQNAVQPTITRQVVQNNTRLQFAPSAVSYHPVTAAGKNTFVPSLRPGLNTASLIYCTDCHNSDSAMVGGSEAGGPHGSNNMPLLKLRYDTTDGAAESASAYALCYSCHDRSSILNDDSFTAHRLHIVDSRTPCSVCHDAHGISSAQGTPQRNSRLINFDATVVTPDPVTGRMEFRTLGSGAGQCFLSCHGKDHSPISYPQEGGVARPDPNEPGPGPSPFNVKGGVKKPTPAPGSKRMLPPPPSLRERNRRN